MAKIRQEHIANPELIKKAVVITGRGETLNARIYYHSGFYILDVSGKVWTVTDDVSQAARVFLERLPGYSTITLNDADAPPDG